MGKLFLKTHSAFSVLIVLHGNLFCTIATNIHNLVTNTSDGELLDKTLRNLCLFPSLLLIIYLRVKSTKKTKQKRPAEQQQINVEEIKEIKKLQFATGIVLIDSGSTFQ